MKVRSEPKPPPKPKREPPTEFEVEKVVDESYDVVGEEMLYKVRWVTNVEVNVIELQDVFNLRKDTKRLMTHG